MIDYYYLYLLQNSWTKLQLIYNLLNMASRSFNTIQIFYNASSIKITQAPSQINYKRSLLSITASKFKAKYKYSQEFQKQFPHVQSWGIQ